MLALGSEANRYRTAMAALPRHERTRRPLAESREPTRASEVPEPNSTQYPQPNPAPANHTPHLGPESRRDVLTLTLRPPTSQAILRDVLYAPPSPAALQPTASCFTEPLPVLQPLLVTMAMEVEQGHAAVAVTDRAAPPPLSSATGGKSALHDSFRAALGYGLTTPTLSVRWGLQGQGTSGQGAAHRSGRGGPTQRSNVFPASGASVSAAP